MAQVKKQNKKNNNLMRRILIRNRLKNTQLLKLVAGPPLSSLPKRTAVPHTVSDLW